MARKETTEKTKKRGKRLAKLVQDSRLKYGLTQEELAIKTKVGIDTLRSIESARIAAPNVFLIADLAKELKGDLNKWLK